MHSRPALSAHHHGKHAHDTDLARLVELVEPHRHMVVLDIATGGGKTALALAPFVNKVVGVDVSTEALNEAQAATCSQNMINVEYLRMDAAAMHIEDCQFDVVTCRYGAHHLTDIGRVLDEVRRVLRPGGVFVLEDKISPPIRTYDRFINDLGKLRDETYVRAYTRREWHRLLRSARLSLTKEHLFREDRNVLKWLAQSGLPLSRQERIHEHLASATARTRRYFEMRIEGQRVVAFTDGRILLAAKKSA